MRRVGGAGQVHRPLGRIHPSVLGDDPAERVVVRARLLVGGIRDAAASEVVLLLREPVPPALLAALGRLAERSDRLEHGQRVRLIERAAPR